MVLDAWLTVGGSHWVKRVSGPIRFGMTPWVARSLVLLLVGVTFRLVLLGALLSHHHALPIANPAFARAGQVSSGNSCFPTTSGSLLCGADARAFCAAHYAQYVGVPAYASAIAACHSVGYYDPQLDQVSQPAAQPTSPGNQPSPWSQAAGGNSTQSLSAAHP